MPYCKRCRMKCDVTNVSTTPSRYIQQGNCSRCQELIYFFTGTADTPAAPTRVASPRVAKPVAAPSERPYSPTFHGERRTSLLRARG